MKKVYIVTGSEDGIIGVFSSKSKARKQATDYVSARSSLVVSDVYTWYEHFSSNETTVTAEILIEELL